MCQYWKIIKMYDKILNDVINICVYMQNNILVVCCKGIFKNKIKNKYIQGYLFGMT